MVTGAIAALCLMASPALAVNGVLLPALGSGASGPHHITGLCNPLAGAATNLNQITYAIETTASAYSTNGSYAVGASVRCYAYRTTYPYTIYGSVSGGLPGPTAAGAGVVSVPTNVEAALCVKANAVFSDNGTASFDGCPNF